MKAYFQKNKLLLLFSLILVVIFVVGGIYSRFMTNQITFHQYKDLFVGTTNVVEYTPEEEVDSTILGPDTSLVRSFKAYVGQEHKGYIYVVETKGRMKGLQIAYAIDLETDQVVGVKVIQSKETPEYFSRLTPDFFNQFINYDLFVVTISIDTTAGATVSSDAFRVALQYARMQYMKDTDFALPTKLVEVNSVRYNTDFATLGSNPIIVNITDFSTNQTMDVSVSGVFNFIQVLTPGMPTPSEDALLEMKNDLSLNYLSYSRVYAVSFDSDSLQLVVRTRGYAGNITFTFVLNAEKTAIVSTTSIQSVESYEDGGYSNHGSVPGLETYLLNRYLNDQTIDTTAGATGTFNGMTRLFTYLDLIFSGNGGQ
jgi:Na+-translocating ferredoxin:NAD+ oxidoreductase RnfG subunit